MLQNYQDKKRSEQPEPAGDAFATVGTVYADGIALIFDGSTDESIKHYRCNKSVSFKAGDRVYLVKDSGTYVVAFPVGLPTI